MSNICLLRLQDPWGKVQTGIPATSGKKQPPVASLPRVWSNFCDAASVMQVCDLCYATFVTFLWQLLLRFNSFCHAAYVMQLLWCNFCDETTMMQPLLCNFAQCAKIFVGNVSSNFCVRQRLRFNLCDAPFVVQQLLWRKFFNVVSLSDAALRCYVGASIFFFREAQRLFSTDQWFS